MPRITKAQQRLADKNAIRAAALRQNFTNDELRAMPDSVYNNPTALQACLTIAESAYLIEEEAHNEEIKGIQSELDEVCEQLDAVEQKLTHSNEANAAALEYLCDEHPRADRRHEVIALLQESLAKVRG